MAIARQKSRHPRVLSRDGLKPAGRAGETATQQGKRNAAVLWLLRQDGELHECTIVVPYADDGA
jgi:hypothetical protein